MAIARPRQVMVKSQSEIATMRRAGRVVAEVLALVESELRPGISTAELDRLAERHIRAAGATPSFKGYPGANARRPFPASICISIDNEVVHGIPGERTIRDGQVVSIDAGAIVDGWHGDGARTFLVGDPGSDARELVETTRLAVMAGIAAAMAGNHVEDIGAAVEGIAAPHGFGVVRQYVGHGIGRRMHEEPQVPNYRTGYAGRRIEVGMCLAIEPMFTLGGPETEMLADDWTVVTRDGSLAAHFEHTIAVTANGPQILTTI
jgi:methionyl aminopeptidase